MLIHITFCRYGFCGGFWRSVWGRYGLNWSLVCANSYNIWSVWVLWCFLEVSMRSVWGWYGLNWSLVYANPFNIWSVWLKLILDIGFYITFSWYGLFVVFWRSVWGWYGLNWCLVYVNSYNVWSVWVLCCFLEVGMWSVWLELILRIC